MNAVVYARVSTEDQAREEKVSIQDQIKWAKTFALERGWTFGEQYIEPGVLGDIEPEDREAASRLLAHARLKQFDIVLVYHSSRFAREPDIGMRMCRLLGQLRIQVYFRNSPTEPVLPDKFSWGNNVGGMYMTAFSFIGDFQENVARSERVRSGFQGLAQHGKLVFAPYGYKKVPEVKTDESGRQKYDWHFIEDTYKASVVRRIFDEYTNKGGSLRSIMLKLNEELVPSPSGTISKEAWSAATIKNILTDPAYIGKVRWGRKLGGKYKQGKSITNKQRRVITKPEDWIVTDGNHPKIIDDLQLFEKTKERLQLRYVLRGRAVASKGLLVGLVLCGRCNRKAVYRTRKKGKYITYNYNCQTYFRSKTCARHIMSSLKLHSIIVDDLSKIASDPKYKKTLLKQRSNEKEKKIVKQHMALIGERDDIRKRQRRILVAYETENLDLEQYGEAKRRLDDQEINLTKSILELEVEIADKNSSEVAKKKFIYTLKNFNKSFEKMGFPQQKELMQNLIQSIIVDKSKVIINYRI